MRKTQGILLAIALCLFICTALFGCENEHKHIYVEHAEQPATCTQSGHRAYYTCEGCELLFDSEHNQIEEIPAIAALGHDKTEEYGRDDEGHWFICSRCDERLEYTPHMQQGQWQHDGENHWKVCVCGEKSALDAHTMCLNVKEGELSSVYYSGATVTVEELKDFVFEKVCSVCNSTVDEQILGSALAEDAVSYQNGTSITDNDTAVIVTYEGVRGEIPIRVVGKTDITLTASDIVCGGTVAPEITATYGADTVVYKMAKGTITAETDNDNVTWTDLGAVTLKTADSATYTVRAEIAAVPGEYTAATAYASFTVSHHYVNTSGEGIDTVSCVCGIGGYEFVTAVEVRKELLMTGSSFAIDLTGIGEHTVKSITFGDHDLGTNPAALEMSGLIADEANHGEQEFTVIVTDVKNFDHAVSVPVLLVTKEIGSADDFNSLKDKTIAGYYKQTADFTMGDSYLNIILSGTYDGNGYSISMGKANLVMSPNGGLFSKITNGCVKNLTLNVTYNNARIDSGANPVVLACFEASRATFENISVNYVGGTDSKNYEYLYIVDGSLLQKGFLFGCNVNNCTFKNFVVNAAGKQLGIVLTAGAASGTTYENFFVYSSGIHSFIGTTAQSSMPSGVTLAGTVSNYVEADAINESSAWSGNKTVMLPEGTVRSAVLLNGADRTTLTVEGNSVTVPTNGLTLGNVYLIEVTYADETSETVPFRYVTMAIENWEDLSYVRYLTGIKDGTITHHPFCENKAIKGYFVLVNDLGSAETLYKLTQNSGAPFNSKIVNATSKEPGFTGVFDGQGYSLVNVQYDTFGIFGHINNGGTIKNLNIDGATFDQVSWGSIFACNSYHARFENIDIKVTKFVNATGNSGVFIGGEIGLETTIISCNVDLGGQNVLTVCGNGGYHQVTYSNVTVVNGTFDVWAKGVTNVPSGVTYTPPTQA